MLKGPSYFKFIDQFYEYTQVEKFPSKQEMEPEWMHLYSLKKHEHVTLYSGCMAYNLASTLHALEYDTNGKKFSMQLNDSGGNIGGGGSSGNSNGSNRGVGGGSRDENDNENNAVDDEDDEDDEEEDAVINYNGDGSDAIDKLTNTSNNVSGGVGGDGIAGSGVNRQVVGDAGDTMGTEGVGEYEEVCVFILFMFFIFLFIFVFFFFSFLH